MLSRLGTCGVMAFVIVIAACVYTFTMGNTDRGVLLLLAGAVLALLEIADAFRMRS
jgi:hypothetical protein